MYICRDMKEKKGEKEMKIFNLSKKSDLQDPQERPKLIDINEEKREQKKMKQDRRIKKD